MSSIQGGTAQILTFNGPALAFAYTGCQSLLLSSEDNDTFVSYSEGGLQQDSTRFRLSKQGDALGEGPYSLLQTFYTPTSGMLYFASANGAATSLVTMWCVTCGHTEY